MTPLARLIAAQIRLSGPMRLDDYMRVTGMKVSQDALSQQGLG